MLHLCDSTPPWPVAPDDSFRLNQHHELNRAANAIQPQGAVRPVILVRGRFRRIAVRARVQAHRPRRRDVLDRHRRPARPGRACTPGDGHSGLAYQALLVGISRREFNRPATAIQPQGGVPPLVLVRCGVRHFAVCAGMQAWPTYLSWPHGGRPAPANCANAPGDWRRRLADRRMVAAFQEFLFPLKR